MLIAMKSRNSLYKLIFVVSFVTSAFIMIYDVFMPPPGITDNSVKACVIFMGFAMFSLIADKLPEIIEKCKSAKITHNGTSIEVTKV